MCEHLYNIIVGGYIILQQTQPQPHRTNKCSHAGFALDNNHVNNFRNVHFCYFFSNNMLKEYPKLKKIFYSVREILYIDTHLGTSFIYMPICHAAVVRFELSCSLKHAICTYIFIEIDFLLRRNHYI